MGNFTLNSLVCSHILHSPFISFSLSTSRAHNFIKMKNVKANYFSSHFLFGNPNLYIKDSKFSNFLKSSLKITSEQSGIKEKIIVPAIGTSIENTVFQDLVDSEGSGAAINAAGPLILKNCQFERCNAKEAAAITACECNVTILHSTFTECSAFNSKGVLELVGTKTRSILELNSTVVFQTDAKYNGVLYKTTKGDFNMSINNFTKIKATECVGTFEAVHGRISFSQVVFINSSADVHHGCLVLRQMDKLFIINSIWNKCQQKSFLYETSACITFDDLFTHSLMQNCTFIKNSAANGKTIYVVKGRITLNHCDFTGTPDYELGNTQYIRTESCIFERYIMKKHTPFDNIGYSKNITKTPVLEISSQEILSLLVGFVISTLFSLVFAYIAVILHKNIAHFYKSQVKKTPLALL